MLDTYIGASLDEIRESLPPQVGYLSEIIYEIVNSPGLVTTLSAAEVAFLDGATAGTVVAGKAIVAGATHKNLDEVHTAALYLGANAGTQVTATAAEINVLDLTTGAGTAEGGKAVVLGATHKNIDEVHTAALYLGADAGTQVTATAAEINVLDRTGAAGIAEASKAVVLDANAAIDAVKTAALHIGESGAEVQVTATAAEINTLDLTTGAGTAEASKAVVLDAAKHIDEVNVATLKIGASGATHAITRTDLASESGSAFPVALVNFRQAAAVKDALPDAPDATSLGLADAAGSVIVGTTVNGGSTASASETAHIQIVIPQNYVAATDVTLRVRAKVSAVPTVGATIDAVVKEFADGALGSDICATDAITLTDAYANCDFTITGTDLVAGDIVDVVLTGAADDTGGTIDAYVAIAGVSLLATTKG